jgi:hypothetical protein
MRVPKFIWYVALVVVLAASPVLQALALSVVVVPIEVGSV